MDKNTHSKGNAGLLNPLIFSNTSSLLPTLYLAVYGAKYLATVLSATIFTFPHFLVARFLKRKLWAKRIIMRGRRRRRRENAAQ